MDPVFQLYLPIISTVSETRRAVRRHGQSSNELEISQSFQH